MGALCNDSFALSSFIELQPLLLNQELRLQQIHPWTLNLHMPFNVYHRNDTNRGGGSSSHDRGHGSWNTLSRGH